jgi:hypothetical protein
MIKKFYGSLKQWIPKHLSIFGRICAAKSYVVSKSWYLASVIPPSPKVVSKINAILWNFIQNNSCLEEDATSNRYFARLSAQTLRQPEADGGLNAQKYDFQLAAIHSKWIFALIHPLTSSSWTDLPLNNLMQIGLSRSLFVADKSILTLKSIPSRWRSYLAGWFAEGLCVAPPPQDFDCLLNEPLWFNRFIKKVNGLSFGHYLTHDKIVSNSGPCFILDVVTRSTPGSPSKLRFLNRLELRAKYDAATAKVLDHLIECIPIQWQLSIAGKVREPFQKDDWIVERRFACGPQRPAHVYKIQECLSGKVLAMQHIVDPIKATIISSVPITTLELYKAHIVKASVITLPSKPSSNLANVPFTELHIYCGSYASEKLLLLRISWSSHKGTIPFSKFSIHDPYKSIRDTVDTTIAAKAR